MLEDLQEIIVAEEQIDARVKELGRQITGHYKGEEEITLIAIINGAIPFAAGLMRHIHMPLRLDCMRISSYRDDTRPVSEPEIIDTLRLGLKDRHVLLIDDILDTGKTIVKVLEILRQMKMASLETCVFLEKEGRRQVDYEARWVGFTIPDKFVVGYGLDFAERYRNLPCIGVLKPELQNPPEWR